MQRFTVLALIAVPVSLLTAIVLGLSNSPATAQDKPAAVVRWEYKFTTTPSEKAFNQLGGEGWELAGTRAADRGSTLAFIFKRPRR